MTREKTTRVVGAALASGVRFGAYEIHLGTTTAEDTMPFATLEDGTKDGARGEGVIGT